MAYGYVFFGKEAAYNAHCTQYDDSGDDWTAMTDGPAPNRGFGAGSVATAGETPTHNVQTGGNDYGFNPINSCVLPSALLIIHITTNIMNKIINQLFQCINDETAPILFFTLKKV